jgi:NADPH:quinone reductase-like Zn-dependent oxidoreductase
MWQGTGGVSLMALKLAQEWCYRVILSSSSEDKLRDLRKLNSGFGHYFQTVNYKTNLNWEEDVLALTRGGEGVDLVIENGGTSSLMHSMKCTKRGGTISQVGYLGPQNAQDLEQMLPTLIDRKINLRQDKRL